MHSYYTYFDDDYCEFMMQLLLFLEPRHEEKGAILFEENKEVDEIILFETGIVHVGFELNR